MSQITIFTDGASRGNPGPGGWGALFLKKEESVESSRVIEIGGREDQTTNNRMELQAVLSSLLLLESKKYQGDMVLYTDSSYVYNGITKWVFGWQKNGWKTGEGNEVLNKDLWEEIPKVIFRLKLFLKIEWRKIDGHSGFFGNERADEIATSFADQKIPLLFNGPLKEYERLLDVDLSEENLGNLKNKDASTKKSKNKKAFSYVSLVGGEIKIHKSWDDCKKRVDGEKGAKFKKVFSKDEENSLVELWQRGL